MIPPPAQRAMSERAGATVVEEAGSHSIYVSQPRATADLIRQAAQRALDETRETVRPRLIPARRAGRTQASCRLAAGSGEAADGIRTHDLLHGKQLPRID